MTTRLRPPEPLGSLAPDDCFLNAQEAAELLGCSSAAIRRWTQRHQLRAYKVGRLTRYRRSDVLALAQPRV